MKSFFTWVSKRFMLLFLALALLAFLILAVSPTIYEPNATFWLVLSLLFLAIAVRLFGELYLSWRNKNR